MLEKDSCRQQVSENRCVHIHVYNGGILYMHTLNLPQLPHNKNPQTRDASKTDDNKNTTE